MQAMPTHAHLRQMSSVYKLEATTIIGGLLSLVAGASIIPWIYTMVSWLLTCLLEISATKASFPGPLDFLFHPNMLLGLIWLLYYGISYLWASMIHSSQQKMARREHHASYTRDSEEEWRFHASYDLQYTRQGIQLKDIPLSRAWSGELKHQLVEYCYSTYRQELKRYSPPPVELKTPSTFFYRKAGNLEWAGQYPVLPEVVLTPERIHELLPFLAHHLAYYNTEKPGLPVLSRFPDCVPLAGLLLLTGNFLWLPVKCKQGIEQCEHQSDITLQRAHVHEADQFAVWLGQGPALEHQLRRIEEVLKQQGKVDRNIPTLIERIGHLEILNHQEREQMHKLGLKPKEPLLAKDR